MKANSGKDSSRPIPDYPYALELLKKINNFVLGSPQIARHFQYGPYTLWAFSQQSIFEDIKRFSATRRVPKEPRFSLKIFLFGGMTALVSFLAAIKMLVGRCQVLVYSVDKVTPPLRCDFRIEGIYRFLNQRNICFGEIFHTMLTRQFVSNLLKRRRAGFYLEAIDVLLAPFIGRKSLRKPLNLSLFGSGEGEFVEWLLAKYLRNAMIVRRRVRVLKFLIRLARVKHILTIDDPRYYCEIILAGRQAGVPTYAFQHGRFNKYSVGWIYYNIPTEQCLVPDVFFVWNEYWRVKLLALSPVFKFYAERVKIGGRPSGQVAAIPTEREKDDIITVLIPYEVDVDSAELCSYIKAFLGCAETHIIFKTRPGIPEKAQIKELELTPFLDDERFLVTMNVSREMWGKVDIVAASHSTMLYEAIESCRPVGVLKMKSTQADELVRDNLAEEISLDRDICKTVNRIARTEEKELEKRSAVMKTTISIEETLKKIISL